MEMGSGLLVEQKQALSVGQVQSLNILALNNQELEDFLMNEYLENPMLENSGDKENEMFTDMEKMLRDISYEMLFLDSGDSVLVKRYKETRRTHPLAVHGNIWEGLEKERQVLEPIKKKADYIIDTSLLLTRELKRELYKIFVDNQEYKNLYLTVVSFGFKYGIPNDADLVFDVRFLPNPYYLEELRPKTGNDKEIREYVMSNGKAEEFLKKLKDMLDFLIPQYVAEGKHQLVIAIGCTGGKHRSVTLANELYHYFETANDYGVRIEHRDIAKDALRKAE